MNRPSKRLSTRCLAILVTLMFAPSGTASAVESTTSTVAAQDTATVATSLITPFFSAYYLEGKLRASRSVALVLNASYLTLENDGWKARSGTFGVGGDYFFQGDALRRWYVEVIGEAWVSSQRHEGSGAVAPVGLAYAGVALVGYQFVFDRGPVIDVGAGFVAFHLPSAHVDTAGGSFSSQALARLYPAAKINVGWAF